MQRPSLTAGDGQQEEGQAMGQDEEEEEEESDYINASELQSPAGELPPWRYIAAQVCIVLGAQGSAIWSPCCASQGQPH